MKNFKILTTAERTTVQNFIDELREHADALATLLDNDANHSAAIDLVEDYTELRYHKYGPASAQIPVIAYRLKEGRCPDCDGTAEYCNCPEQPADMLQAA